MTPSPIAHPPGPSPSVIGQAFRAHAIYEPTRDAIIARDSSRQPGSSRECQGAVANTARPWHGIEKAA